MIQKLNGIIDEIIDDGIIIDVHGVGYFVKTSNILQHEANVGERIELRIHHVFKKDFQMLCGFKDKEEIDIFRVLLNVQGVGAKIAFAILSEISPSDFATVVVDQEVSRLCEVGGVGKKMAMRILMELKDQITKIICVKEQSSNIKEAILGLVSLGYAKEKIYNVVYDVAGKMGNEALANELIIQCLKIIN